MGSIRSLRRPPVERLDQPANVRLDLDLVELERFNLFRLFSYWRQPVPLHVAALIVVIGDEQVGLFLAPR